MSAHIPQFTLEHLKNYYYNNFLDTFLPNIDLEQLFTLEGFNSISFLNTTFQLKYHEPIPIFNKLPDPPEPPSTGKFSARRLSDEGKKFLRDAMLIVRNYIYPRHLTLPELYENGFRRESVLTFINLPASELREALINHISHYIPERLTINKQSSSTD